MEPRSFSYQSLNHCSDCAILLLLVTTLLIVLFFITVQMITALQIEANQISEIQDFAAAL